MSHVNLNESLDSYELDANGTHTHTSLLVLATLAASLLVVVIISGNLLVITAFFRDERLRSIANHFLVSLSCADLLVGGVIVPFYIYFYLISEGRWYHGNAFCYFFVALDVSASTASILHLCVISADRYIAIAHPMMYPAKMTKGLTMCLIASAWCISLGLSYPLMYYGYFAALVQENTCPLPNSILFNLVSAILTFYLPTAIMIVLYRRIFLTARSHSRRLQNGRLELSSGVGHDAMRIHRGGSSGAGNDESRHRTNLNIEYKAAKTVGIVIGAFLFCWFPFYVVFVISPWCETCNKSRAIFSWLGFINSAVNPFIYAFTSSSFKAAFMRILRVRSSGRRPPPPPTRESTVAAKLTSSQEKSETLELGSIIIALRKHPTASSEISTL